jgi:tetratricopeptide (TPR) repeat protein
LTYALLAPRATFDEFVKVAAGLNAAIAALAALFLVPALWIVFRGRTPKEATREAVSAWRWHSRRRSRLIATLSFSAATVIIVTASYLRQQPTRFELAFDDLMIDLHQEQVATTEAKLAQLRTLQPQFTLESGLIDLATFGIAVQRAWLHRSLSVPELEETRAKLSAWASTRQSIREFDTRALQGRLLLLLGRPNDSADELAQATRIAATVKQQVVAAIYFAETNLARRQYNEALQLLQLASEHSESLTSERRSVVIRKRGICKALLRDWEGAAKDFAEALKFADTTKPIVLSNLGFAQTALRQYDVAVMTLGQAINAAPTDPVPRINLAIAHTESGQYEQARDALELAWTNTSKTPGAPSPSLNAALVKIVQAWVQVRQNGSYRTGVVDQLRQGRGLPRDPEAIKRVVRSSTLLSEEYITAAEMTIRHQNLHGLEFIAFDFLNEAKKLKTTESVHKRIDALLSQLPAGAAGRAQRN